MSIKSHEDLLVWQRAMDLVEEVCKLVRRLPKEEQYELSSQMRRAVTSIPSNIAEGHGRGSLKEYLNFLSIARGSQAEIHTQLHICVRMGYLSREDIESSLGICAEVGRLLNALISSLNEKLEKK